MSCNITAGIAKGCNTNIGGVKTVYFNNGYYGGGSLIYEMDKQTASLVETYNINSSGSILGFTQTLTIQLNKMDAAKQAQIKRMAANNYMFVRVETNDGTSWTLGSADRPVYLASGTSTTGTAYTDTNQSELVLQAHSKEPMSSWTTVGTVEGYVSNYMAGCYNYPPFSPGGQRRPFHLQNATGDIVLVEPFSGAGYFSKFETDSGWVYECTSEITATYNSNAFDAQGNSVALYSAGYGVFSIPNGDFGITIGEPTQPGVQTTFTAICEFTAFSSADSSPLTAWTSLDCATTPSLDRRFSGPATANITIRRRRRLP